MKVLILGSSNDTQDWGEGVRRRHEIARDQLAQEFGEPVDVEVKNLWPNERVAEFVARWVTEAEPDLVYLNVTAYPFSYESLPLRLKRKLGPFGAAASRAGFDLAESKRWAHNAVFRTVRRWGQATIGGDDLLHAGAGRRSDVRDDPHDRAQRRRSFRRERGAASLRSLGGNRAATRLRGCTFTVPPKGGLRPDPCRLLRA
jgi:hypothetical protein